MYYDTHPSRESSLTLDDQKRNRYGDPMPKVAHRLDDAAQAREGATQDHIRNIYDRIAKANGTRILSVSKSDYQDHPAGGARMGQDPKQSVCDSHGRTPITRICLWWARQRCQQAAVPMPPSRLRACRCG